VPFLERDGNCSGSRRRTQGSSELTTWVRLRPGDTTQIKAAHCRRRDSQLAAATAAHRWRAVARSSLAVSPRETLFNWLQFQVNGAVCLDLFAGSGALGLEALSRGAAEVVFIEQHAAAAAALRALLAEWKAGNGSVFCCSADRYLQGAARPFNMVFIDPPYADGLLGPTATLLSAGGWLAEGARIYLERSRREPLPALPPGWRELRAGTAGEVGYHLFEHRHAQELDS